MTGSSGAPFADAPYEEVSDYHGEKRDFARLEQ
jgi:hypothetical protein